MYTYHLQHLIFDAAEMVGISRDLAYASVVLGSSNNVKFPLAWGTVLQSIKPIRYRTDESPVVGFENQVLCTSLHSSRWSRFLFFLTLLTEKDLVTFWCFVIVNLYIIHIISNFIFMWSLWWAFLVFCHCFEQWNTVY